MAELTLPQQHPTLTPSRRAEPPTQQQIEKFPLRLLAHHVRGTTHSGNQQGRAEGILSDSGVLIRSEKAIWLTRYLKQRERVCREAIISLP